MNPIRPAMAHLAVLLALSGIAAGAAHAATPAPSLSCAPAGAHVSCTWSAPSGFTTSILWRTASGRTTVVAGPTSATSFVDAAPAVGSDVYTVGVTDGVTRLVSAPVSVNVAAAPAVVGYVGCSNTWMTMNGYHDVAAAGVMWPTLSVYSGGSVDQWVPTGAMARTLWTTFDQQRAATPPATIWWQVCTHPGATLAQAQTVLNLLRTRVGNVPIYVSPLATYANGAAQCPMADPVTS